jgi:GNAT superfamily N-acetyltransferase
MIEIRTTPVDALLDIRHRILRAGLPRDTASFEGDNEVTTSHFAAFEGGKVVGSCTILQRPLDNAPAWQLRGMAVEPNLQGKGVGRKLVEAAEAHVRLTGFSRTVWCNARVPASRFYEKMGWTIISQVFDIPSAGLHVKMLRRV